MAVIGRIRKRAGLIVALVGVALFAFVLSDLLFKGQGLFRSEQYAGKIAGASIPLNEYDNEVQRIADMQKERSHQAALPEEAMDQIRDEVWKKLVNDMAMKPQYHTAGISVSDAEIKDLILGNEPDPMVIRQFSDPNTGQIAPRFRDPMTGRFSPVRLKQTIDSLAPEEKSQWAEFEEVLRGARMEKKYLTLVKHGLFITDAQAKNDYENLNRSVSFNYILKPYSSLADASVKVEEKDLMKYYNEHQSKYKQDASRKLEYAVFNVSPTQQDFDEVKKSMEKLSDEWKNIKEKKEDSLLTVRESDSRMFDTTHYGKGQLPLQIDSLAHAAEIGTIFPVFLENNSYKLCKVMDYIITPDSAKARHILIRLPAQAGAQQGAGRMTPEKSGQAKADSIADGKVKMKIDSIKKIVEKKKNFEEMAKQFGEDGTKEKGGDLGWFKKGQMAGPFEWACYHGKKGDLLTVRTQFGWHLIEIMDQSERTRKTSVAIIERKVEPGTKTRNDVYTRINDFIDKYHTTETFEKGIEKENLVKRVADPLRETDKTISGLDNPRDVIRWAFNARKGDVTTVPFSFADKYVVAHLAEVREEGIAPMEQKKEEVEIGARKDKKAEKIIEEIEKGKVKGNSLTSTSTSTLSLEELASRLNLTVQQVESASFSSYAIPGVGKELNLMGILFALRQGQMSAPVKGESGVYVARIEKITEPPATKDFTVAKTQAKNNFSYRADMEVLETIKKHADIKDLRAKFY